MSKRGGKKQQQAMEDDEDEIAFLLKAAEEKKEKIKQAEAKHAIPEEVFKDLPEPPIKLHPNHDFKERCIMQFTDEMMTRRRFDEEAEKRLQNLKERLPDLREGGIIHQSIREWAMNSGVIAPGVNLNDMCARIEEGVRRMTEFHPPERGLAFPCGCSINECAAHYSPLPGDTRTLKKDDVMKIDFGVAINGQVVDSAFTVCFDPRFDPLIQATKEATETGIKMAGPEARISEIGAAIEEVITSYSLEIKGKTIPLKPVYNLSGHQLGDYTVHCGKTIPIYRRNDSRDKMLPGELYALETFATTGKGIVLDQGITSHFMVAKGHQKPKNISQKQLLDLLTGNFKTLAFCQRFIERAGERHYTYTLQDLVHNKIVDPYPPLCDKPGSYISQHEHTFAILEDHKEIFSRI